MRELMMTVAVGAAVVFGGAGPAGAVDTADPGLRSLCASVADRPPGGAQLTTDPAPGAPLRAGQTVTLTLRWGDRAFTGELHRVAHCIVTLDGRLRLDLSASEAPSANDGVYRGSFVVPADLAPGECLCVLGVASGPGRDGSVTRAGGDSCVTVTDPAPPRPPATTPPATTPPATIPPAPTPPTVPDTAPPAEPPTSVLPATQTAPPEAFALPAGQPGPLPLAELPRTGSTGVRLLVAGAGLALVVGGGGIAARRR